MQRTDFIWPETCGARTTGDYCQLLWAAPLGFSQRHMPVGQLRGPIANHEATRGTKSKLDMVRARIGHCIAARAAKSRIVVRGQTNKQVGNALGADRAPPLRTTPQGDGENAGPIIAETGLPCRADRRLSGASGQTDEGVGSSFTAFELYCPMGQ